MSINQKSKEICALAVSAHLSVIATAQSNGIISVREIHKVFIDSFGISNHRRLKQCSLIGRQERIKEKI